MTQGNQRVTRVLWGRAQAREVSLSEMDMSRNDREGDLRWVVMSWLKGQS